MAEAPPADFDWLALTKLAPPALRPDLLPRPRLFDTLRQALATYPVTLVSAPAGSGKTILLAMLVSASPKLSFTWLSLDEDDNDPARFFGGISAALRRGDRCGSTIPTLL